MWLDNQHEPRTFPWPDRHTGWLFRWPVFPCAAGRGLVRLKIWVGSFSRRAGVVKGPEPADGGL